MNTIVIRTGQRLKLEAQPNGKARTPVKFSTIQDDVQLTPLDAINLTSATARARIVDALPPSYQEEGDGLLEAFADEQLRAPQPEAGQTAVPHTTLDPEPWPQAVDGAELLEDLSAHVRRYVHLPAESADAIAAWCALTWYTDSLLFAPLLALWSASKRCGKSVALALVSNVVRRGRLTSAFGITPAVFFRLNERDHPVLCLDEAEKLKGRHTDSELLPLINDGYRRGGKVLRVAERGGARELEEFDAFGFRACALIGKPFDTIADRCIVIELQRKPRHVRVDRFITLVVEAHGRMLARKLHRWTADCASDLNSAIAAAERPEWLGDRDCDNWAGLFAIGALAGGEWPERLTRAARALAGTRDDDGDEAERLIHDVRSIFAAQNNPAVIQSGELVEKLDAIETSPWGAKRDGKGMTPHGVAAKLRPFGVGPRQARDPSMGVIRRGYWLQDLQPLFERYPAPELSAPVPLVPVYQSGREERDLFAKEDESAVTRQALAEGA